MPLDFVVSRFVRQFSPIWCAVFLLVGWGGSAINAQSDVRTPQNRNIRDVRTTPPPANPAAVMLQEMQESRQKLPWNELLPSAQTKIRSVVGGSPLFHRMPQQTFYADPEIYHFLLRHPEMVIGFWEHLGATQLSLREVRDNQYILKETGGTVATVEVLYRTNDLCIVYARGEYRGPLLAKPYQGDTVLILRTQFMRDETNEPVIVCDLDVFVQIHSLGADVLAKLFFGSLTKIADGNFEVTIAFVSQVSKAAARNANALKRTAEELPSVRQEVCTEFCDVVDRVAMRFARRNQPTPLATARQQPPLVERPSVEQSKGNYQDFMLSTKPPADWGMDHFFDSPLFSPYGTIHNESIEELSVPKSLNSPFFEYAIPKLPKREK